EENIFLKGYREKALYSGEIIAQRGPPFVISHRQENGRVSYIVLKFCFRIFYSGSVTTCFQLKTSLVQSLKLICRARPFFCNPKVLGHMSIRSSRKIQKIRSNPSLQLIYIDSSFLYNTSIAFG